MELGRDEELPEAARAEDRSTLPGRLRIALYLNAVSPGKHPHRALLEFLAGKQIELDRRVIHNWFRADARTIDSDRLFKVADALGVSARWLASNDGQIKREVPLQTQYEEAIEVWNELGDPEAQQAWLRQGRDMLAILKKTSPAMPYSQSTPQQVQGSKPTEPSRR